MSILDDILRDKIRADGPVDIGAFMNIALGHPEHGYYMNRDPFGAGGDFTTAPEVSQMFGELLGAWVADIWTKLDKPDPFILLECGPGRGTLMADALRATKAVPGFHAAMKLIFLETSPFLMLKQREALGAYTAYWAQTLDDPVFTHAGPVIVLANEFLDALPAHQLRFSGGRWHERTVIVDTDDKLAFGIRPWEESNYPVPVRGEEGDIFEYAPAREDFGRQVARLIAQRRGAALFVDYGHAVSAAGDTLQAVKGQSYVPVLKDIGAADLTSHVDFQALGKAAQAEGAAVYGPAEQGAFLERLGIRVRAERLTRAAEDEEARQDIAAGLQRLTGADEMGRLFKVMAFTHSPSLVPEGFS